MRLFKPLSSRKLLINTSSSKWAFIRKIIENFLDAQRGNSMELNMKKKSTFIFKKNHILKIHFHKYHVNTQIWTDFFTKQRTRHVLNLLYFHFSFFRSVLNFSDTQFSVYWNTVSKNQNTKKFFCMCAKSKWKIPARELKNTAVGLQLELKTWN